MNNNAISEMRQSKKAKHFIPRDIRKCEIYEVALKFRAIWFKTVLIYCLQ